ncbi:MAG: hypothetical protein R2857_14815 [Vampirovibrionales bacterium]
MPGFRNAQGQHPDRHVEAPVIDDASSDAIVEAAQAYLPATTAGDGVEKPEQPRLWERRNWATPMPRSRVWMLQLLMATGSMPPEILEDLITPIARDEADVVLGSKHACSPRCIAGAYSHKYVGNRILTMAQNRLLDSALSEFHTGYRVFRTALLRKLPFTFNDDGFAFDTDILIQCLDTRARIVEQPIPTFYGSEVCRVNGMRYAWQVFSNTIRSRLHHLGLFSDPRFEYTHMSPYESKLGFDSSHEYVFRHIPPGSVVLDIGCGSGAVRAHSKPTSTVPSTVSNHLRLPATVDPCRLLLFPQVIDLDHQPLLSDAVVEQLDVVLLLDVIEHLNHPEAFLLLRRLLDGRSVRLILTTGTWDFCPFGWGCCWASSTMVAGGFWTTPINGCLRFRP